jgi:hypothetical protein
MTLWLCLGAGFSNFTEPPAFRFVFGAMARKHSTNDNQLLTRAELEASNRELKASLRQCEELLSDCKDKLVAACGLTLPDNTAEG